MKLPAYVIAHDAALAQIVIRQPTEVDALHEIRGMGPYRVESFGAAFLAVLQKAIDATTAP